MISGILSLIFGIALFILAIHLHKAVKYADRNCHKSPPEYFYTDEYNKVASKKEFTEDEKWVYWFKKYLIDGKC